MDYNAWAKAYDDIFPLNEDTLAFLKQQLNGKVIADIGCGSGNYTKALATQGYDMTGIDITKPLLELARNKTQHLKNVTFREENMLSFKDEAVFDTIFSIGNSLVHLLDLNDIEVALKNFHRALKPGGTLIVQIVNYNRILSQRIESLPTIVGKTYSMKRKYRFNGSLINFQTILKRNSQHFMNDVYLYPLRQEELDTLSKRVGFSSADYYDGFTNEVFDDSNTFSLVAVLKK